MTLQAREFFVFPQQGPVGLFAVVEASLLPATAIVATLATVTVTTRVNIAATVTGHAVG